MWNYRVIKTTNEVTKEDSLELREVYYNAVGKPMGHCPAILGGETIQEMTEIIIMMSKSFWKYFIDFDFLAYKFDIDWFL